MCLILEALSEIDEHKVIEAPFSLGASLLLDMMKIFPEQQAIDLFYLI
jgi:hypothetical protein